jgi:hypothetical protein
MKNKHTRQPDLETLSAYLDHELSDAEEQAVRSQVSQDPALQRQLEDLRQTRYILRHTPKVRRARSFVLTPEMVQRQRFAAGAWNVSRWVSAVASVLLIVMIGGQYLLSGGAMTGASSEDNIAFMADEAMEAPAEEPAEETMMLQVPEEEAGDDAIAPFYDETDEAEAEPPAAADMAPMETSTPEGTPEPGAGGELLTPTQEIMGLGGGPTMTPDPNELRTIPLDKTQADADDADGQNAGALDEPSEVEIVPPQPGLQFSPWRLAQAGLLALAVVAGIAAAFFRKQVK